MKKIALLFLCCIAMLFFTIPVSATNISKDSYIYDETGSIEDFYIKNINILGQKYFEESGNRVIYYISDSLSDDTDYILKNELDTIEYDANKSVLIVGYSPTTEQFYIVHNEDFWPRNLDVDVAKIRDDHFMAYLQDGALGNALMQVYGYFCNIVRNGYNTHKDEKAHERYIREMRIVNAIAIIFIAALISVSITIRLRVVPVNLLIFMFIVSVICIIYIMVERIMLAGL